MWQLILSWDSFPDRKKIRQNVLLPISTIQVIQASAPKLTGSPGQANKCVPNMEYKSASVLGAQPRPSGTLGRGRLTLKYETLGLVLVEYVIAIELSAF